MQNNKNGWANRKKLNGELLRILRQRKIESIDNRNAFFFLIELFRRIRSLIRHQIEVINRTKLIGAIERLSAFSIVRIVPDFHGTFELISKSNLTLMVLEHSYENALIPFIEKILKQEDHVIDVGANIGLYANLSSKLVGPQGCVLAIEPHPLVFELLESNIKRNQLNNIICFKGVATLEPGFYKLNASEGCPEYSSLGAIVHPHAPKEIKEITVEGETIDNLVTLNKLNPVLLKIDVEGAEGLVLSGATMVLEKYRPYILSELDDRLLRELKWDASKILNLLEKYYYDVFDAVNGSALSSKQIDGAYVGEIIALPKEAGTFS